MELHPGLRRLFSNLSIASRKVEERKFERERLRGYLRKIRIVAEKSPKKSVIHEEIKNLEKHFDEVLDKKLRHVRPGVSKEEREEVERLKHKEKDLSEKIARLNDILGKLGKKVDEKKLLQQLDEQKERPSLIDELEEKLYTLESKYYEVENDPKYPREILDKIKGKISSLKEKIRYLKTK